MDFDECIQFATEHPICAAATVDGDQPRVRMLGMWFATKEGFYFSTAKVKAMCRQLTANHKVELCFYAPPKHPPGEGGTMGIGKVLRAWSRSLMTRSSKSVFLRSGHFCVLLLRTSPYSALRKAKRGSGPFPTAGASLQLNGSPFR